MPHELINALEGRAAELSIKCEKAELFDNCYKFENVYVIIEMLQIDSDLLSEDLRKNILAQAEKHLSSALNLRNELPPASANDIHLIYVCTPTETNSNLMKCLGSEIERDDRVCRKLLWRQGVYGQPVDKFIDKTFFARPWKNSEPATADALRTLTNELDSKNAHLLKIILNDDFEGEDFVKALMTAVEGGSES